MNYSGPTLLALDPSSTCTGYAFFAWPANEPQLIRCGRVRPKNGSLMPDRLVSLCERIGALLGDQVEAVVMEVPSGKGHAVHRNRNSGGAGLATYGRTVGWIERDLWVKPITYHPVEESAWVGSRAKSERIRSAELEFGPVYSSQGDGGGDTADAVCLGAWWIRREALTKAGVA